MVFEGVDVFEQSPATEVDVLLVVDDSCSMRPYQEQLATTFDSFVRFLDESDTRWHIGVTTTDAGRYQGELVGFVAWDDPDAAETFAATVNVGTEGSGYEMGLEAARRVLEVDATGFIREQARFSAIFVSDEEDGSPLAVSEYIREFEDLKGARSRDAVNASALVWLDTPDEACSNAISDRGDRYIRAAEETAGVVGDLCQEDLGPIVTDMGLNASRMHEHFELSTLPNAATLELTLDDEVVPCDEGSWTYTLREGQPTVSFDRERLPEPEARLVVRYQWGNGAEEAFCP